MKNLAHKYATVPIPNIIITDDVTVGYVNSVSKLDFYTAVSSTGLSEIPEGYNRYNASRMPAFEIVYQDRPDVNTMTRLKREDPLIQNNNVITSPSDVLLEAITEFAIDGPSDVSRNHKSYFEGLLLEKHSR